jgi:ABC-type transporter Mla subunit MlaD
MRKRNSIAGSPILIGAATILVSIVAVFLAYTANQGLPFVPAYELTAQVPNADALVRGNDVKIGGSRVGQVVLIRPKTWPDGRVTALIDMKLDKQIEPLAVDSTVQIRPVSPLGLKYVDIHRGISTQGYKTGTTLPIETAAKEPVQIDDFFNMFDKPTRDASSANLIEFGNALAGRGLDLNQTIRNLVPLLTNLQPVMKNLNDPKTGLAALFPALERSASLTAPVAEEQASTFRGLATTFEALSTVTASIQAAIVGGPPALDAAIKSFPYQQKFLNDSTTLFATLVPGSQALGAAAPTLNKAVTVGVGSVQRSATILNPRLADLTTGLGTFYANPDTMLGINRLISTTAIGNPLLTYITPAQATCNYASVLLRNIGSLASDGFTGTDPDQGGANIGGTFNRAMVVVTGWGTTPDGPWTQNADAGSSNGVWSGPQGIGSYGSNVAHINPFPTTGQPTSVSGLPNVGCGAGNESWNESTTGNPLTSQSSPGVFDPSAGTRHGITHIPAHPPVPPPAP